MINTYRICFPLSPSKHCLWLFSAFFPLESEGNQNLLRVDCQTCFDTENKDCYRPHLRTPISSLSLLALTDLIGLVIRKGGVTRGSICLWNWSLGTSEPQGRCPSCTSLSTGESCMCWTGNMSGFWHSDSTLFCLPQLSTCSYCSYSKHQIKCS
jgi:hypothetical protein